MSIPPLVCSTPPPPDQCEDDKDTEEYDIQYSLSQDDDENIDYDFRNYSTYNNCETSTLEKQTHTLDIKENMEKCKMNMTKSKIPFEPDKDENMGTDKKCEENLKYDEDINIEDLNLKVDNESVDTNFKDNNSEAKLNNFEGDNNSMNENSAEILNIVSNIEDSNIKGDNDKLLETSPCKQSTTVVLENDITCTDFLVDEEVGSQPVDGIDISSKPLETGNDSDFGEFDDFQFIRSDSKITEVIETCDNPWESEAIENSDFGDFTANFEDNKNESFNFPLPNMDTDVINESKDQLQYCSDESDFDDFDNFQSSTAPTEIKIAQEVETGPSVQVLNIQSCDDEPLVIENINKLLSSIFEEEIVETESETEVRLESLLTETWGYLIETDIRQPYIVNWNHSLGQKTLLRALCIDSRNILFGPKWGHNMPKYAANLSVAPLQPQKQLSASNMNFKNDAVSVEISVNKPGTWTDPFAADGQESCNIEGESSVVEPRPTDIDVFKATMSSASEKKYPTSIDIQPIRQINLPETHIFTPTDSETPRSKTTHYNFGPPVLLPQQVAGSQLTQTENNSSDFSKEEKETEDDDWEFQGFNNTTSENSITNISTSRTVPTVDKSDKSISLSSSTQTTAYQTQVLQPIKIEPIIPTLNWPDPGEVKHVFEDFTDFISNSSCNEKSSTMYQNVNTTPSITDTHVTENGIKLEKNEPSARNEMTNDNTSFDDDFDTFQSALPPPQKLDELKTVNSSSNDIINSSQQITNNQIALTSVTDFDHAFKNVNNVKSDSISFTNNTKSNEPFATNFNFTSTIPELSVENSLSTGLQPQSNILLQPTPVNTNTSFTPNQSKSGQILQPLSLESYSQINWPSPGIDLQDLSRFNPVDTLHSLKNEISVSGQSKNSPIHNNKNTTNNHVLNDDVWGEFVSSKPKQQPQQIIKNQIFNDDDEWTDFVSSSSIKPQNGLNTISLNVHTNSNMQKNVNKGNFTMKNNQLSVDIPTLNYITPKSNSHKTYNDRHFQNL